MWLHWTWDHQLGWEVVKSLISQPGSVLHRSDIRVRASDQSETWRDLLGAERWKGKTKLWDAHTILNTFHSEGIRMSICVKGNLCRIVSFVDLAFKMLIKFSLFEARKENLQKCRLCKLTDMKTREDRITAAPQSECLDVCETGLLFPLQCWLCLMLWEENETEFKHRLSLLTNLIRGNKV